MLMTPASLCFNIMQTMNILDPGTGINIIIRGKNEDSAKFEKFVFTNMNTKSKIIE